MTAYGRASLATSRGRYISEIQSLNRKHLEIVTFLPKEFSRFDSDIRKLLSTEIYRGQINVKLFVEFEGVSPVVVKANLPLARQLKAAWNSIAKELNVDATESFSLSLLADDSGVLIYEEEFKNEELYRSDILQVIESSLNEFINMRQKEGMSLQEDIQNRLGTLRKNIEQIALFAPNATLKFQSKIRERLQEILKGATENEERILREVCLFAEKVDIMEEITRFNSHLTQCAELLKARRGPVGKTFEFLLQELNREINTIGSKASDVEVSQVVVNIKSELERVREQIQNIE